MQTIGQGEKSMKQELLTNQGAAITTHDEENVRTKVGALFRHLHSLLEVAREPEKMCKHCVTDV
jgi:hypothetical protein